MILSAQIAAPQIFAAFMGATRYGAGSGLNADGSPYACRHVASRRYFGKRVSIYWRFGAALRVLRNVPVRDKSGRDVIDFPSKLFDQFFGQCGRRLQPRHGWRVRVVVLGPIQTFGRIKTGRIKTGKARRREK